MGLFRKKETTHFERDEEGRVVQVTHNGEVADPQEIKMKSAEQLEREYYTKHPEKSHPTLKKIGVGMAKLDKRIVKYNRRTNIMNPQRTGRVARPVTGFGFNPPSSSNANPFGSMFDTGLPRQRKKKKPKIQYKVISGKAYPIAGTGPKKTKKKKPKQRRQKFHDPFESWKW